MLIFSGCVAKHPAVLSFNGDAEVTLYVMFTVTMSNAVKVTVVGVSKIVVTLSNEMLVLKDVK